MYVCVLSKYRTISNSQVKEIHHCITYIFMAEFYLLINITKLPDLFFRIYYYIFIG